MSAETPLPESELQALIGEILDENRILAIATLRPDGWPQTTLVGYVHEALTLYFAVARESQKFQNISRDGRVSIAIGLQGAGAVRGLSMAARADEVTQPADIARINALIWSRYPEVAVFAPRAANSAVIRVTPQLVSVVDDGQGLRTPMLLKVSTQVVVSPSS